MEREQRTTCHRPGRGQNSSGRRRHGCVRARAKCPPASVARVMACGVVDSGVAACPVRSCTVSISAERERPGMLAASRPSSWPR